MESGQKGFATLTVTLLITVILAMVTLYAAKVMVVEKRIAANETAYSAAFALAESGLDAAGKAFIDDDSLCDTSRDFTLVGGESIAVSWSCIGGAAPVTVEATYRDSSTGAKVTLAEAYTYAFLLDMGAPPPLSAAGFVDVQGSFRVGANPNGGGNGVPVSIWSGDDIDMTNANGKTCAVQEFSRDRCASDTYSERGVEGEDLAQSDPNFPDDLLAFTFGVPIEQWETLLTTGRIPASNVLPDCTSLDANSTGIFLIEGDCNVNGIGAADTPVVALIRDGSLKVNGNDDSYGIFFSLETDEAGTAEITTSGNATIYGAVMANHNNVKITAGAFGVTWHPDVFDRLLSDNNTIFKPLVKVAGSWRDFEVTP
ncbi:PilX N-terminal domain-containing pilus assembly protein [Ferrimonas balearica]|uniref:pilus assembly PilX family protein n=1 Tax=Ferrimonas balearica TaxID=44012 RepID=UPI001C99CA67|nr:PilX N-terminal domain-containing pilus assembly protein [Ferrimonas balearica]MBY5993428.1 hypothetical protein [Ferrimonas balearica]